MDQRAGEISILVVEALAIMTSITMNTYHQKAVAKRKGV